MSNLSPPKIVIPILLLAIILAGCSHQKTKRGHLVRGDWAIEYNRTPWIGCPPDVDCYDDENERKSLFSCLTKDNDGKHRRAFRRHCAMAPNCTSQAPCCRTLGCGMWVEPDESTPTSVALSGTTRVCGLTPFCFPQNPCGLTPSCGKPANVNVNPQTLALANQPPLNGAGGMPTIRGMNTPGLSPGGMSSAGIVPQSPAGAPGAVQGTLVSRGIVPGASAITSGGIVAAIGVATPAGTMTPIGVRLPNGTVSNAVVLRACTATQHCTAARPCGLTPLCGGAVAINLVANNAIALASALQAQGIASGVMQAGGMGMLVNPMTNQPVNGLTMSGMPQVGYPPIGYAPSGYAPGYPRYAAGMIDTGEAAEHVEEEAARPETRSQMPVPRFHPIPSQPTFQRSEGMAPTPPGQRTVSMNEPLGVSEQEFEAALDHAYLQGVAAAMDDVERKLEEKRQAVARARLEERILQQAESVQQQLDEQARIQMLAMQRAQNERQIQQRAVAEALPEPQRLPPPPRQMAVAQSAAQSPANVVRTTSNANVHPLQLAESLKASVANGVSEVFAPLLTAAPASRGQVPAQSQSSVASQQAVVSQPQFPGRPPVSPVPPGYGLLPDDEPSALILQANFAADNVPIRP